MALPREVRCEEVERAFQMSIQTVQALCKTSDLVQSEGLVEQIANVEDVQNGKIDPDAFFRRNHFTSGLDTLIRSGFDRLSGRSETGAYYLSQSMGGGKTHALIAFALLAQDDGLRHRYLPAIAPTATFGSAKVVIFNGHQDPEHFLWGEIAERLGRPEAMARFWKNGAKAPGVEDWVKTLGDEPVLILLDELPSYLQLAEGQMVGNLTLADITIGALERLFNALMQLKSACVVVTNLLDDVFAEGSGRLKTLIHALDKQYGKYAHAITPVQQNTGEVFQIIRKKLFDDLPSDDAIESVAQAYVDELNRAKKVDDIPVVPESYIARIRESYPFHPSIRDIVARFKENSGYQQTRALIRILRLAVRNAFASSDQIFLVGLQHLDFNSQSVLEEVSKINRTFGNAISKDLADRGNANAEKVDAANGSDLAESLSKLVLMASLSTAADPILGLRRNEIVEFLIDPLTRTPAISAAVERFSSVAEFLFNSPDQRLYFGPTANVTSEVNNTAASLAEELVDQELREKLTEIFKPRTRALYRTVQVLPALDEVRVGEDEVTLVVVERPPHQLKDLADWWKNLDRQNRVLFVFADNRALGTLRLVARQMRAISVVERSVAQRHSRDSSQVRDIELIKARAATQFTSAARETFSSLAFPTEVQLREYSQFRMQFDNNDYSGEEQILKTLKERGKYLPLAEIETNMAMLRAEAEESLFDANAVQRSELRRKAAARPGWYWLEGNGLDHVIDDSIRTKHWREHEGLIEKKFTRTTSVTVRLDGQIEGMVEKGVYDLSLIPADADKIYASETGDPDPAASGKVVGRSWTTSAAKVSFKAVDSRGEAETGPTVTWLAPIKLVPEVSSTSDGFTVAWKVLPRSAQVFATIEGGQKRDDGVAKSPLQIPRDCTSVCLTAKIDGHPDEEVRIPLSRGGGRERQVREVRDDVPLTLKSRQSYSTITVLTDAIAALGKATGASVRGGRLEIATDAADHYLDMTIGDAVSMTPESLRTLMAAGGAAAGLVPTKANASFNEISFATGKDFKNFADAMGIDFETADWAQ